MANKNLSTDEKEVNRARALLLDNQIIIELGELFSQNRHELYIVGGSVRDALLGRVHDDFDFATDAAPDEIVKIVNEYADELWKIGMQFGTIGLEKNNLKIEITTFRRELYNTDSRQPQVDFVASIETDLSRRDFTVNAMAFKLPSGEFLDLFNGLSDLTNRELKTPLSPEESFSDDPLRMLRALRFVSTLITEPAVEVLASIKRLKKRLEIVSAERIQTELSKLLLGLAPSQGLYYLATTGLADEFLPELSELASCIDPLHRHKDLLEHTLTVVENVPAELDLRLAALLHDIGKPRTKSFGPDGVHFYHHEILGAKMAKRRLRALKYPSKVIANVSSIIEMHMRFHTYRLGWADSAVRRYVRDCGPHLAKINQLVRADCTSRNPNQSRKFALLLDELDQRIAYLEKEEESAKIRAPLNGNEVMEYLQLAPGPEVGKVMKALLEARLEEKILTKESAYKFIDKWLKK
ncbi:MAG TPA: CCA tRNA nucleotidyltransferase [Actinobacteria bacterium]|nr:CCA tRNA nucleotidyltransferase [Actinomycetes bacterium]HEX21642.1 CCA tRNA nucleotidyltransferase [Actinomycetota bacterium]